MTNYIKEQCEFDMLSTIKFISKKWAVILAAGILCAASLGGYKYMSSNATSSENSELESDTSADYDRLLASYNSGQAELDSATQHLYDAIEYQNEYFDNSVFYNLNCNSVPTTMLTYKIDAVSKNYINPQAAIYNYYLYGVANGDYLYELATELGTEPQYLNELIFVETNDEEYLIQPYDDSDYYVSFVLTISVCGSDKNMCDTIADRVAEEVEILYQNDSSNSEYALNPIIRTHTNVHSNRVLNAQQTINNYYDGLFGKVKNYSGYKNNISAPASNTGSTGGGMKSVVKYTVLGGFIGVVLACAVLFIIYAFNGKVSDVTRFKCRYNVSDLGLSPAMIATNIRLSLEEKSSIVFLGTADQAEISTLVDSIRGDLDGYSLIEAYDILYSPDQRMKLRQADNIVLVEKKKKSKYSEIDEELKVLAGMNKNVIGVVLI